MSILDQENTQPTYQQERLSTGEYNHLVISTAEEKQPYVFISYKSENYDQVFALMAEMQERYGLRLYYDKAFDQDNEYWVKQMLKNLVYPVCSVILCFISKPYVQSYATLIELMHSQVGDDYGESIPVIPIFMESLPLGNGADFRALDSAFALSGDDTKLPSDGPERTVFNELLEKMVLKLDAMGDEYEKNTQTVANCLKHVKHLEKGKAPVIDTRFAYRLFKEMFNSLHCNQFHLENYRMNMDQFYADFHHKILSVAGDFSPFEATAERKDQEPEAQSGEERESTYETLEPHEYVMEDGVLKAVTTKKPYIILPDGCSKIERVVFFEDTVSQSVFFRGENKRNTTLCGVVIPDSVTELGYGCFASCTRLKEVAFPQGLARFPEWLFSECSGLERLAIPDSVKELGEGVFFQCSNLKEVILPQGVETLPAGLFGECSALEELEIPASVKEVEELAFAHCEKLKEVTLSRGTKIHETAFGHCSKELHFLYFEGEEAVKEYVPLDPEEYELDSETVLSKVTTEKEYIMLPEGVTILGEGSLGGLSGLKGVQFPDSLREVDEASFIACHNLKEIQLPTSVTALQRYTFSGCRSLEELTLPSGVLSVEEKALEGCTSLKKLVLSEGMTQCPEGLFADAPPLEEITLPSTLEEVIVMDALGWESSVLAGCTSLKTVVFGANGTTIPRNVCHSCSSLERVVLPETLTAIETGAFTGCSSLLEVILPPSLTQVKEYGFKGCTSLTSVTLPDGVREVGRSAFGQCSNLKEITLPEGITVVEDYTFEGCASLEKVTFPSTLTHVKIGAFLNCKSLKVMNLSPTVKVEENAFRGCVALQQ